MRIVCIAIILFFSFSLFSQAKKVKIKLVQYVPYCNGIKSKQDLENTPNKSIVYANKKLIVITDQQITDTVVTDKSGYINVKWAYGTYLLYEPWKHYRQMPKDQNASNINMDCLKEEWLKEDLKIVVSKKTTTIANNIKLLKCADQFPCLIKKTSSQ